MGEGLKQMYGEVISLQSSRIEEEEEDDELGESSSLSGGSDDEFESPSSDHATTSDSSHVHHHLSSLVSQLPIKRGLSKFYQGKSQSFSSFSDVSCVEDLAKKEAPQAIKKKMGMKPSRSYAEGLDDNPSFEGPNNYNFNSSKKREVGKSTARGSCASSIARTTSGSTFLAGGKPPIPMHKNLSKTGLSRF